MTPSEPGPPARPREGGFVLLEILIALVIFSTVVLAYFSCTDSALVAAARANSDRRLRNYTSRKLAEIRARPTAFRDGGSGGFEEDDPSGQDGASQGFRWEVEPKEMVAAGRSTDSGAEFLFSRDSSDTSSPTAAAGSKTPDPVKLLRLTLTVSMLGEGDEPEESMRVVVFVLAPADEGKGR